ncbi:copper chaperone PCu(A)C [Sphingomonas sp. BIUV-7]|uniref:Copper chaperone PCu(A)C n=1 Tax=Sphingomonas natans TaxID=3063330 RepID=A0ABT8YDA7_9SPHN|nr:copper chaperone PCu(A)C [Sphingomonas sp. BIUV-7]MDO6415768.1 copper chaperone PCu(A)C [Sphingomonas sp. BIUV-7]
MIRIAPLVALLVLAGCGGHETGPKITKAWVRLAAAPGRPAAAYFTIQTGHGDDAIVRVESALVKRIEMHESMTDGHGMSAMKPLADVAIPAGGAATFAPSGKHLMLFDVDPVVTPGTAIPLRFGFASGRTAEAEAKTVAAGDDAPY